MPEEKQIEEDKKIDESKILCNTPDVYDINEKGDKIEIRDLRFDQMDSFIKEVGKLFFEFSELQEKDKEKKKSKTAKQNIDSVFGLIAKMVLKKPVIFVEIILGKEPKWITDNLSFRQCCAVVDRTIKRNFDTLKNLLPTLGTMKGLM